MLNYKWYRYLQGWDTDMRVHEMILRCVVYLYPDKQAAAVSKNAGGSGFMAGIPSEVDDQFYYTYAVSNAHVTNGKQPSPVIRINTQKGSTDVIEKTVDDWVVHPDHEDLAACYIEDDLDQSLHEEMCIPLHYFVDDKYIKEHNVGIGDEIYITGRFQKADGKLQNTPTIRFGNIAQMPIEPIENPLGYNRLAYLAECHSISGFSGSPVFLHIDEMTMRPGNSNLHTRTLTAFLGVDMAHLSITEKVMYKTDDGWERDDGLKVLANSAMMSIVPASKLAELLNQEKFVMARKEHDKKLVAQKKKASDDSESVIADHLPDITEEDFKTGLKKAARKIKPSESDQSRSEKG